MRSRNARSKRFRYCAELSCLFVQRKINKIRVLFRDGLERDLLPRRFFEEVIFHLSLLLGYPAMLEGFELLLSARNGVGARRLESRRSRRRTGNRSRFEAIYGKQSAKLLENLRALHPELPELIRDRVYGDVFTRPGLSLAEREIVNVVVLALHGFENQLYSHVRGARRTGVKKSEIVAILTLLKSRHGANLQRAERMLERV